MKQVFSQYRDKKTAQFAAGTYVKEFHAFKEQAERRLDILDVALNIKDLRQLPSNRFEALQGDIVLELTSSGGFVLNGMREKIARLTLKSLTIIKIKVAHILTIFINLSSQDQILCFARLFTLENFLLMN